MFKQLRTWFITSVSYLWLIVLAAYFSVLAGQAIYRNYQSQQITNTLKEQLAQARQDRERLESLVGYYSTDSFREKELRRSLLLKKPDETVYALPESAVGRTAEEAAAVRHAQVNDRTNAPYWRQWLDYILGTQA